MVGRRARGARSSSISLFSLPNAQRARPQGAGTTTQRPLAAQRRSHVLPPSYHEAEANGRAMGERETAEELAAELAPGGDSPGDLNDVLERAYVGRHGASVGLWEPGRSSSGCSSPTSPGSSRGGRG